MLGSGEQTGVYCFRKCKYREETVADMVEAKVKQILLDILDIDAAAIVPTASLDALGASSVDAVEILAALENEFDIDIPDEDTDKLLRTVEGMVEYLQGRTS